MVREGRKGGCIYKPVREGRLCEVYMVGLASATTSEPTTAPQNVAIASRPWHWTRTPNLHRTTKFGNADVVTAFTPNPQPVHGHRRGRGLSRGDAAMVAASVDAVQIRRGSRSTVRVKGPRKNATATLGTRETWTCVGTRDLAKLSKRHQLDVARSVDAL